MDLPLKGITALLKQVVKRQYNELIDTTNWQEIAVSRAIARGLGTEGLPPLERWEEIRESQQKAEQAKALLNKFIR